MLDRYIYGTISRISPEAPVPVIHYANEKCMLGGVGNVVRNLVSLSGGSHSVISVVGSDPDGKQIEELLCSAGSTFFLVKQEDRITTTKSRLIASGQQVLRLDKEHTQEISQESCALVLDALDKVLPSADFILLSDYNKGFFTPGLLREIIRKCTELGKKVAIDPRGTDFTKYAGAFLIKPNRRELSDATRMPTNSTDEVIEAAQCMLRDCRIENAIVTLSGDGMVLVSRDGRTLVDKPLDTREVYDVTGAGDTALSAIGLALATEASFDIALRIANLASQIVVGKTGTATASGNEIRELLRLRDARTSAVGKVVDLPTARRIVERWHESHQTVCFTNGCFDLLHFGHISSFIQARKHGDKLIVGINSDNSVRRSKGPSRPIQDEVTRAAVVASLEYVDLVVRFEEPTALELVKALKPDVIAKEGYELAAWPEAQYVQSRGGKVVFLEREQGYSTTEIVRKIDAHEK
jgi:D-beta-D-heptose 7-phosphate kinase/D-beta-D-heptose 1-phosphate adenosyltransferase